MEKILEKAIKDYYKIADEFGCGVDSWYEENAMNGITAMVIDVDMTGNTIKDCDGWEETDIKPFVKHCKAFIKKYLPYCDKEELSKRNYSPYIGTWLPL